MFVLYDPRALGCDEIVMTQSGEWSGPGNGCASVSPLCYAAAARERAAGEEIRGSAAAPSEPESQRTAAALILQMYFACAFIFSLSLTTSTPPAERSDGAISIRTQLYIAPHQSPHARALDCTAEKLIMINEIID